MSGSVIDNCNCCRKDREEEGLAPRSLDALPVEIINHKLFKRKGLPVRVCIHCDGDVYPRAMKTHNERTA